MKRLLIFTLLTAPLFGAGTKFSDAPIPPAVLYAGLGSAAAKPGYLYRVTDCLTSACTIGGGTEQALVFSTGSAWVTTGTGASAPSDAKYITQTANSLLSAEQALGSLSTGCLGSTTTTGVVAARTLTGTANQISIANGDCSGAPTFSLPSVLTLPGTINNLTLTAPATAATLTLANNSSLITVGAFGATLTFSATTNSTFPAGTKTLLATDGSAAALTAIPAGSISGVIPIPNLATGTPDGTKFIRDDGTLAVPTSAGNAPSSATYITQTANGGLSAEQALGSLSTGCLGSATTTGVVSARTLTGTANEISVANGDCSGTPTFSLPAAIDLGGKTSLEIPNAAAPTVSVFGQIAGDNNLWASGRGAPVFYDGTAAVALIGALVSDVPSNGQVPTWNTGGTITWETPGSTSFTSLIPTSADATITWTNTGTATPDAVVNSATVMTRATAQAGTSTACVSATGNDTYTCTLTPSLTAYANGMCLVLIPDTVNTGAATLDVDSIGPLTILNHAGTTLSNGDIPANLATTICTNSNHTNWTVQ